MPFNDDPPVEAATDPRRMYEYQITIRGSIRADDRKSLLIELRRAVSFTHELWDSMDTLNVEVLPDPFEVLKHGR